MKKIILIILILSCSKMIRDIDFKNKDIDEELAIAIINNDVNEALKLINEGANINHIHNNRSILELALDNRNLEIMKGLLKKEIQINKDNIVKIYDLALDDFNYEIIDIIKDKYRLKEGLIDNNKYFLLLCYISNAEKVKRFTEKYNINPKEIKDKKNRNGLILSAVGNKIDIFKMLVEEYNLDINCKNDNGVTSLIAACTKINREIVELIIEKGANINDKNNNGRKALIIASKNGHKEIAELLLEKGTNFNDRENKEWTALMLASQNGHTEIVKLLLEKGANINDREEDSWTVLMLASEKGYIEVVRLLLEKGAKIDEKDNMGLTSLMISSQEGHTEVVRLLLEKGAKIDEKDDMGWTVLMIASQNNHTETAKLLLEKGANVNDKNNKGWTALMIASQNNHIGVVKLLLEKGANFDDKNNKGWTALMIASQNNHVGIVKLLLEKGANFDDKNNNNGWTALMLASENGHIGVVNLLLEKGANVNDKNNKGWTVLMIASQKGHTGTAKLLLEKCTNVDDKDIKGRTVLMIASKKGYTKTLELLLERGANSNDKDVKGWTVLMIASENGHIEVVRLLLEKCTNVDDKNNNNGWTALMLASQNGHIEVVNLLLEKGANINDKNNNGWTALMLASQNGHTEVVNLLLEKYANINDKNNKGCTALIIASFDGHTEVVNLLLEKCANFDDKINNGWTALMLASKNGHIKVVNLLIKKGAKINERVGSTWRAKGKSALTIAYEANNEEVIELLVSKGADISGIKDIELEEILINNIKSGKFNNCFLMMNKYKDKINYKYKDKDGNNLLHYTAFFNNDINLFQEFLKRGFKINAKNNRGETPLYKALCAEKINENFIIYLLDREAILNPSSYINGKVLIDVISSYEKVANIMVYEPLISKLLVNKINLSQQLENKTKEIIRILKLKEEDFENEEQMIKFIKNSLIDSTLEMNLNNIIIKEDSNIDVELNIDVFDEIFVHFKEDDFCESVIDKGINKTKEIFKDRLIRIKNALPIVISYNASEEERGRYIDFIAKKKLHRLLSLISATAGNGKNNERIRMAVNELLDHLVCRNGSLEAINAAIRYLSGEEDTELKDIINEELMTLRYEILKEVINEEIRKRNINVEIGREVYETELTSHLLSHLTKTIGNQIKVKQLYDEDDFNYKYDKNYITQEVIRRYKLRIIDYIINKTNTEKENVVLRNKVQDYIEREIFKGRPILQIEDFIYDEDFKLKAEVVKALLIHLSLY